MKNIIFDIGGVITVGRAYTVLDDLNLDSNTYNILKEFFLNTEELDLGNMTLEEKFYSHNFSKELEEKYKDYLLSYYKHRKLNMNIIDLINRLKENGYNIYILSDNIREACDYYKSNELYKSVDGWIFSCEYGTRKIEGKLFDIILDKYHLNPNESYFIDDRIDNIEKAEEHGITCYQYNDDIESLISDMRSKGIVI